MKVIESMLKDSIPECVAIWEPGGDANIYAYYDDESQTLSITSPMHLLESIDRWINAFGGEEEYFGLPKKHL